MRGRRSLPRSGRKPAGDHDWCIPRQERIEKILIQLIDRPFMWPVMGGGYYPSEYPVVQRQRIETALVNLRDNPSLLERNTAQDPWMRVLIDKIGDAAEWVSSLPWP